MKFNAAEFVIVGFFVDGFFYGLYSGIFAMYLQYHASRENAHKEKNLIFCGLCLLYVLSVTLFSLDLIISLKSAYHLVTAQVIIFACSDFLAQFILIYRCWIVWGRNIRVVIVPLIIAFAFLALWITGGCAPVYNVQGKLLPRSWSNGFTTTALAMSMVVNALVTGLIVFRIFKVFREVKATSDKQVLGTTCGSRLRFVIFVLIESGMALFSIQLIRVVVCNMTTIVPSVHDTYNLIVRAHEMFNGITPTIILVRVSMGLSFHDEDSMLEVSVRSLRFASPNDLNPTSVVVDQAKDRQ